MKLKIVNPNAAGIYIAYGEIQACVPEDRDGESNRCFGSCTCDYEEIASWLKACGITTMAMESTGSYWVGLYFFLEEKCFDVLLANAKDVNNVSGKRTDEADAEWIMLMPSYGLLKPSFHPDAAARSIRELARHRDNMLRSASKEVQHMQKHPHPDSRLRGGDGQTFRRIHGWIRHGYARLYGDKKAGGPKNAISFDAEKHAFSMWGVNAMEIPGMSLGAQTILMGELGSGFTEKFTSAKSFCKWCNLVPNNKISGGKLLSSKVPKQKNRVGQVFRLCANSVKSVKTGLGIYFRRQKSKGGHLQAIVATANKIAKIFYTMVVNKNLYDESKVGLDEKQLLERKIIMAQRTLYRLNLKLSVAQG